MRKTKRTILGVERLEDRLNPSFTQLYSAATDTLILTQVAEVPGATTIVVAAGNTSITEGANPAFSVGSNPTNLIVNMLNTSTAPTLNLQFDTPILGNVTVNAASGTRAIGFTGASNVIGGNLFVQAGTGGQVFNLASAAGLNVGGNVTIGTSIGSDIVASTQTITVGGNLTLNQVDTFVPAGVVTVGGNMVVQDTGSSTALLLTLPATSAINGNLAIYGTNLGDVVNLVGISVNGSVYAYLYNANSAQQVNLGGSTVNGGVAVVSGTVIGGGFSFTTDAATVIDKSVSVRVGPSTPSATATFLGTIGGSISYYGGAGADTVTVSATVGGSELFYMGGGANTVLVTGSVSGSISYYGGIGANTATFNSAVGGSVIYYGGAGVDTITLGALFNARAFRGILGAGNDVLNYTAGATVSYLYVDFGLGTDTFNGVANAPSNRYIRNLP